MTFSFTAVFVLNSQAVSTQEGSSFESASSIYSLARVDAITEEITVPDSSTLQPEPKIKSPSHSVSSGSSDSYCKLNSKKQPLKAATSTPTTVTPIIITNVKVESVSDDEKSENRYSSSGYYESPHDDGELSCEHNMYDVIIISFVLGRSDLSIHLVDSKREIVMDSFIPKQTLCY